ncbi:TetR/AcrR family transcriptional regulator [Streptomyces sp. NPDC001985]|uniref:TetR/AcrR family transcriptional regulator n=1 Tax=Streptomyces sp. NPDC001985 TaxID=3154406 RepID=UPI003317534C
MPLPRFHRLPPERREQILAVAQRHFAGQGPETASYNRIIEAVGFSKTSAYQYFDGRDDLLAAVLDGVHDRLLAALGPWPGTRDTAEFWDRLEAGSRALVTHLRLHPDDLALAGAALAHRGTRRWLGWFTAVVENGQRLGVIRTDTDQDLLVAVTAAVFRAADEWALAALGPSAENGPAPDTAVRDTGRQVWSLLHGLWTAPAPAGRAPATGHRDPGDGGRAH